MGTGGGGKTNLPFLQGGVSDQEAAYADYLKGQGILNQTSQFASQGMGASTNLTEATTGPRNAEALQLANISDKNQAASAASQLQLAQQQGGLLGSLGSGLGGLGGLIGLIA